MKSKQLPKTKKKTSALLKVSKPKYAKVAISIPTNDLSQIEKLCHRQNLSRSRFILLAIRRWFEAAKEQSLIEQYIRGYQTVPEDIALIRTMQTMQRRVLDKESW